MFGSQFYPTYDVQRDIGKSGFDSVSLCHKVITTGRKIF